MRLVVQKVSRAAVEVDGRTVGALERPGLLVLAGVTHADTPAVAERLADKLWNLRILDDERSCAEVDAPLLVVSQFTLYADVRRGRRPSWSDASPRSHSEPLVAAFVDALRRRGASVATGEFGAHMQVTLTNDGPVTLVIDSDTFDRPRRGPSAAAGRAGHPTGAALR
nr:D-tyrosyl-tRNA(Tyr) deacylase [Propionibacterium sp.]